MMQFAQILYNLEEYIGYFLKNQYNTILKGTEFIVTFIGGENVK